MRTALVNIVYPFGKISFTDYNSNGSLKEKSECESWSVVAAGNQVAAAAAAAAAASHQRSTQTSRRGSLQLWQFLVSLLDDPNNASCIVWTGRGTEFKLVEPEEVWLPWADFPRLVGVFLINYWKILLHFRWPDDGVRRKIGRPWITISWVVHWDTTTRKESCRK